MGGGTGASALRIIVHLTEYASGRRILNGASRAKRSLPDARQSNLYVRRPAASRALRCGHDKCGSCAIAE